MKEGSLVVVFLCCSPSQDQRAALIAALEKDARPTATIKVNLDRQQRCALEISHDMFGSQLFCSIVFTSVHDSLDVGISCATDAVADCCWARYSCLQDHLHDPCDGETVRFETAVFFQRMWFF